MVETVIDPNCSDIFSLNDLLRKEVKVQLSHSKVINGWVQAIDPISKSLVLLTFTSENTCSEIIFVPGYNIKTIQVLQNFPSDEILQIIDNIFKKKEVKYTEEELSKRREALSVWFSGNRVPYILNNNLDFEVLQVAKIKPPYCTESIHCNNEVVLDKVMKLVESAPGLEPKQVI